MKKINQKDYKFYLVKNGKIVEGFEYREDAIYRKDNDMEDSSGIKVFTKSYCVKNGINPDDNSSWQTQVRSESKKHTVSKKMKLTKLEESSIRSFIKNRISEGIDNRSIDIKIKKENGTFWFFLQHDNGEEENITNVGFETIELARHAARMKGFNIVGDKGDKQEDSFNKRPDSATPPKPAKREKTPDTETPKEIDLGREKTIKLEEILKVVIKEEIDRMKKSIQKKNSISEGKITKKIESSILELNDLQSKIAKAQAEVDAVIERTGLKDLQKKSDSILKNDLWDFLEELKKDDQRVVKLKNIIMRINRFQASPATYEYEKVIDDIMALVNQDVKQKILMQLKASEKIGKTKANVSFTTEALGSVWNSVSNFLGRFIPALKKRGEKIDNAISKSEDALSNIQ